MEFKSNFSITKLLCKLETRKPKETEYSNIKYKIYFCIKHKYKTEYRYPKDG